jgi:uncharacterized protein
MNMQFVWSSAKSRETMKKHGIDFGEAQEVFDDPFHLSLQDRRFDYFEERWVTVGKTRGGLTIVVGHLYLFDAQGEETIRVITARNATKKERECHETVRR